MIRPSQTSLGTVCCKTYQPLCPLTAEWNLVIYVRYDPVSARGPVRHRPAAVRRTVRSEKGKTGSRLVKHRSDSKVYVDKMVKLNV